MQTRLIADVPVHVFPTAETLVRHANVTILPEGHLFIARTQIPQDEGIRCPIPCSRCPLGGTGFSSFGDPETYSSCRDRADFVIKRFFSTLYTRSKV